ncbi:MAG: carboxypeptidase regulatory-like domain-containing protein [Desulfobacterales bacterium]|nr:carboxypeptidase regulatory-like domain-containing protein [Desulfobacterales bacterium]
MFKTLLKLLVFFGLYLMVLFYLPSPAISQEVKALTNMGIDRINTNVTAKKIETWTNMGLYGGQILDIAIDPASADKIFVGTCKGDGLFVTEDGGKNWRTAGDMFKNRAVLAVKIAPSDSNIIWAAHNNGVEKSTDGGESWTRVAQGVIQCDCQNYGNADDWHRSYIPLAIDPSCPQTVYMGTTGPKQGYYTICKTENGGKTWTKTELENDFDCRVVDIAIDPLNTDIIWAVTGCMENGSSCAGGLYRSKDKAETWETIMTLDSGFTTVVVKPDDSNRVFTGSYSDKDSGIREHYLDGDKWLYLSPDIPINEGNSVVLDIAFDPQDPDVLYAAWKNIIKPGDTFSDVSRKVSRSVTGGQYWETYIVDYEFNSLAVHPANSDVIFGGERYLGVYKSNDHGRSWCAANNGISAVLMHDVAIDPNDSTRILAGTPAGIYKREADKPWSQLLHQETYSLEFHPTDSLTFYAAIRGRLARTQDGGDTWTYSEHLDSSRVNDIAIYPDMNTVYMAASQGSDCLGKIYKSIDGGTSFSKVLLVKKVITPDPNGHLNSSGVKEIVIDPDMGTVHIVASQESDYPGKIYKSVDGGALFSEVLIAKNESCASYDFNVVTLDPNKHLNSSGLNDIAIDSDMDSVHIAASQEDDYLKKIYKSENGGVLFAEMSVAGDKKSADYDFNVIVLDSADPQHLFAGSGDFYWPKASGGLWESTNGGETWELIGLSKETVNAILIDPRNSKIMYAGCGNSISAEIPLYKSTNGGKTWRASFKGIPGKEPNFLNNHSITRSIMKESGTSAVTNSVKVPLYKSTDGLHYYGSTTSFVRDPRTFNRAVTDLEFHRKKKNVIYASTYGAGVYISPDKAENWLDLGTPKHNVRAIAISSCIAATHGGMYTAGIGSIVGSVKDATDDTDISGATVSINFLNMHKHSGVGGGYSMRPSAGNYTLTASAAGYNNESKEDVKVSGGGITIEHFHLSPAAP